MSNVIDLAQARKDREPHVEGELFCMGCNHHWRGVWPTGTTEFKCPSCGAMRGRNVFDVAPHEGSLSWTCNCGNQLFHILEDRIHCPGCGQQTSLEVFAK